MPSTLAVFRGAPAAARVTDRAKAGIRRTDRSFVRIIVEFGFQDRPRPPRSKYKYANAWHQGASSIPPCNADTEKRQSSAALDSAVVVTVFKMRPGVGVKTVAADFPFA